MKQKPDTLAIDVRDVKSYAIGGRIEKPQRIFVADRGGESIVPKRIFDKLKERK